MTGRLYGDSPEIPRFAAKAQIVFTDSTGRVVGGSTPILIEHRVTLVGSPNDFAHQRLMQACAGIVPSAGEPGSPPPNCDGLHHATEAPMPPHLAETLSGRDDDEGDLVGENYGGSD